jgi:vrille protein
MVLEQRVIELTKENHVLKAQLDAIKDKYNISGENLVSVDQILATLPTSEQVLSITKRLKPNAHSNGTNYDGSMERDITTPKPSITPVNYAREHQFENSQPQHIMYSRQSQGSPFDGNGEHVQQLALPQPTPPIIRVSPNPQSSAPQQQQQQVPPTPVITTLFKPLHQTTTVQQQQPSPQQPHHQPHDLHKFILLNKNGESLNLNNNTSNNINNNNITTTTNPTTTTTTIDKDKIVKQVTNGVTVMNNSSSINNSTEKMVVDDEANVIISSSKPQRETVYPHIQLTKFLTSSVKSSYIPHHTFSHHHPHLTHLNHPNSHYLNHHLQNHHHETSSVLNLSRRTISNGSGSDIGNDNEVEHFGTNEYYNDYANHGGGSNGNQSDRSSTVDDGEHDHDIEHTSNGSAASNISIDNNCLPLKLRHKTHFLGEKESAATALLALHNIKQEPSAASHSPVWDNENSSDERDSGISIEPREVNPEWSNIQRKIIVNATAAPENFEQFNTLIVSSDQRSSTDSNIHLKTHLARLESEISTIKNMMILGNTGNSAPINA